MPKPIDFRPVILAGGSGTRFWPRSRRARAKQVLALDGERSMIQQTVERLKPLAGLDKTWIITNEYLAHEIADQLPGMPAGQIVQEPVARNTAPACGLAAFLIERQNPEAVLGVFPSDHVIADEPRFLKALQKGIAVAAAGENIVVLGIEPTRAETGYGYIETGDLTPGRFRAARAPLYREAQPEQGRGVCGRGQLLLELGDVSVVGADAGQCGARAPAGDRSAAGDDCRRLRHAAVRRGVSRRLSQVRKHLSGLRGAGAALGQGRASFQSLLPSGGVQLERSGLVGLALRVPASDPAARRSGGQRGGDRRP